MAGSLGLFDRTWLTSLSESGPRNGGRIDTLQIHHAAGTSLNGARALMDPGGRTVSSNGLLGTDGTLYEVVQLDRRPFTSATGFDRRSLTVETINTTGAPGWGISDESRERLARLAVAMYRAGILGGFHRGPGGIIGHSEVPGTYATACPGPDMRIDWIAARARTLNSGTAGETVTPIQEEDDMTPEQAAKLDELHAELVTNGTGKSPGWTRNAILEMADAITGRGTPEPGSLAEALKYWIPILPDLKAAVAGGKFADGSISKLAAFLTNPTSIDTVALAAELKKQGITFDFDAATLAKIGKAARDAIVKQ